MALWQGKKNLRGMGIFGAVDNIRLDNDHYSSDNGATALCGQRGPIQWKSLLFVLRSDTAFSCRRCLKVTKQQRKNFSS